MTNYRNCIIGGSGQCIPYTDFKTTSAFQWGTTSADPMSGIELRRIPVEYMEPTIVMEPYADAEMPLIWETGKGIGQCEIILDEILDSKIRTDIKESDAILTMVASEEVLGRDWDTPEEDEAWAHL